MFMFSSHSYVEILTHNIMLFGGRDCGILLIVLSAFLKGTYSLLPRSQYTGGKKSSLSGTAGHRL